MRRKKGEPRARENGENVISFFSNRRAGKGNNTLTYVYPRSSIKQVEGSPTPSLPTSGTAAHGAKAHSPAYEKIIPQARKEQKKGF